MTRRPVLALTTLGVLAAALFLVVYLRVGPAQQVILTVEVGKALTQVIVVGALGAIAKFVVDRYQDTQHAKRLDQQASEARNAQDQAFRQDIYQRVVQATNRLRRVAVLVEANRSTKTYSEQMLEVIDVGLDLRMLKHQIYSGRDLPEPPFKRHRELTYLLRTMYRYTDVLAADFGEHKKELGELQRRAEAAVSPRARARLQAKVWARILGLPSVRDMVETERAERGRSTQDAGGVREQRRRVREQLSGALVGLVDGRGPGEPAVPGPSWVTYQEAEGLALELITAEAGMPAGTA